MTAVAVRHHVRTCGAALLVAVLASGPGLAQKKPTIGPSPGRRVGDLAYDFTLKDLNGNTWSMEKLRGSKVVHLVFWASWCVPCLQEIPLLREAREQFAADGLEVLGVVVPMNQTPPIVRAVARDYKITYPILFDAEGDLSGKYKVATIPQNFLIGRDGIIRYAGNELPGQYQALVRKLLEEPVPPSKTGRGRGARSALRARPLIDDPWGGD